MWTNRAAIACVGRGARVSLPSGFCFQLVSYSSGLRIALRSFASTCESASLHVSGKGKACKRLCCHCNRLRVQGAARGRRDAAVSCGPCPDQPRSIWLVFGPQRHRFALPWAIGPLSLPNGTNLESPNKQHHTAAVFPASSHAELVSQHALRFACDQRWQCRGRHSECCAAARSRAAAAGSRAAAAAAAAAVPAGRIPSCHDASW